MSIDKYDRQTRLWGEGQIMINKSRVLSFNSDSLGCEVLKNLVLAGVGYIGIVDDKLIDESDNNNFFLCKNDSGKKRGEVCLLNLIDLNPNDVKGEFYYINKYEYLQDISLHTFDLLILSNTEDEFNDMLIRLAEKNNQRVIILKNYGLLGYIRIYENFHANMNLRLIDNPVIDLRIANPWFELKEYCLKFDLDSLDYKYHSHVPYIIILIKALEKYKYDNHGNFPNSSKSSERESFKNIIKSMEKFKIEGEDNFKEALNFYYYASGDRLNLINTDLEYIFKIIEEDKILYEKNNTMMSIFFIILSAIKLFYEKYNTLPVVGSLPDMVSDTETYITLKKIYESKGKEDRKIIKDFSINLLKEINLNNEIKEQRVKSFFKNIDNDTNNINYIDLICKNWPQLSLFKYTTLKEEKELPFVNIDLDEEYNKINFIWYLLIKSSDLFYFKHKRYPGEISNFTDDINELKDCLNKYFTDEKNKELQFDKNNINEVYLHEFCRLSTANIPPVVSIIGSIGSQEIIKLLTYQFKTVDNTIIFDGIHSTISTFKF